MCIYIFYIYFIYSIYILYIHTNNNNIHIGTYKGHFLPWQYHWLEQALWESLNFVIFFAICIICKPNINSKLLSYTSQLPTDDYDDDYEKNNEIDHETHGTIYEKTNKTIKIITNNNRNNSNSSNKQKYRNSTSIYDDDTDELGNDIYYLLILYIFI